ncbi:LOW QUALITY PROTEIN: putative uncharacterized protein C5orf58 homolog [Castor canadensis]|uniref:Uncharacterized protein n=1 Tax=Castor canadensis TaxID=51338 RepID=A0AC58L9P1_CASCN
MPGCQKKAEAKNDLLVCMNIIDHKQKVEAIIKNMKTISAEVKKMKELSQLLLCDLTLQFTQPMKEEDLKETEQQSPLFEESETPDVFFE